MEEAIWDCFIWWSTYWLR